MDRPRTIRYRGTGELRRFVGGGFVRRPAGHAGAVLLAAVLALGGCTGGEGGPAGDPDRPARRHLADTDPGVPGGGRRRGGDAPRPGYAFRPTAAYWDTSASSAAASASAGGSPSGFQRCGATRPGATSSSPAKKGSIDPFVRVVSGMPCSW